VFDVRSVKKSDILDIEIQTYEKDREEKRETQREVRACEENKKK
jgi:hypothetical protein